MNLPNVGREDSQIGQLILYLEIHMSLARMAAAVLNWWPVLGWYNWQVEAQYEAFCLLNWMSCSNTSRLVLNNKYISIEIGLK